MISSNAITARKDGTQLVTISQRNGERFILGKRGENLVIDALEMYLGTADVTRTDMFYLRQIIGKIQDGGNVTPKDDVNA